MPHTPALSLALNAPPPHTAQNWARLGLAATALRETGLSSVLGDGAADPLTGSRLFGPLLAESGLDPQDWATLLVVDVGDLAARGLSLPVAFAALPPTGWLHIALPRATAPEGYGELRLCHIPNTPTPLPETGHGFGWADPEDARDGIPLSWSATTAPKPASWIGFHEARAVLWTLGKARKTGEAIPQEEGAFLTALDSLSPEVPAVSLGLDPHWSQDPPGAYDPRFRDWPPLLALHAGPRLRLGDGGTLGIHAQPTGADPALWPTVWAMDSL